ncbi:MAG: hypothetical protein NT056_06935 [Proteobacteria bacterium]|nr:hypothetical protein [Pseudomonadota bacterium]
MKKASFVGVVVSGIVMVALMIGSGAGCGGGTSDNANVANGKTLLAEEKGDSARTVFTSELTADPDSCGGLYGRILADVQVLSKKASDLVNTGGGLFTTEYTPSATTTTTDLYQVINPILTPFVSIFVEMEADTDRVAELDCTFQTDSFPVSLYTSASSSEPAASATLSGEWTKVEALMIGGEVHMALAMVDFVSAHSLKVNMASLTDITDLLDIEDLLSKLQSGSQINQVIYQIRAMGALLEDNPDFLTKSSSRWDMMEDVPKEMAEGFSEFNAIFDALEEAKGDPAKKIIGFDDKDNNGFDAGDELSFGIKQATISGGTTKVDGLRIVIPDVLSSSFVQNGRDLLDKATDSLKAASAVTATVGGSSSRIGLSDISPLLTVFSDKLGSMLPSILPSILPSMQIPSMPDVIEVDLKAFFTNPKPLRDFMPVILNHEFVIEGEVDASGTPYGAAIVVGDNAHFLSTTSISADCITAQADAVVNPIPYIEFSDPTFNGLLWINLDPIDDNVTSCSSSDPVGYNVADQYSLNKLIAGLMVMVTTVPTIPMLF